MQITINQLADFIELEAGFNVYRDVAPADAAYPYVRYQYVFEQSKRSSNTAFEHHPTYQISLFTRGVEQDMYEITDVLDRHKVSYEQIEAMPGSENDEFVTHFSTYVRCIR